MSIPKRLAIVVLAVIGAGALAGGIYYAYMNTPPNLPDTAEEGLAVIGTTRFANMPAERKQEYLQRTNELMRELPEESRREMYRKYRTDEKTRAAMREVRQDQSIQRIRELAKLDEAERQAALQEIVAEREKRRADWERRRAERAAERQQAGENQPESPSRRSSSEGSGRERRSPSEMRDRIHKRIETGNPQHRALRHELREATGGGDGPPRRGPR